MDPAAYEVKFAAFLEMCADAVAKGIDGIMVPDPQTLGDDYDELCESLNRMADAKLTLMIKPRGERE